MELVVSSLLQTECKVFALEARSRGVTCKKYRSAFDSAGAGAQETPLHYSAAEDAIASLATKFNVFHTIQCLLQYSAPIREKAVASFGREAGSRVST